MKPKLDDLMKQKAALKKARPKFLRQNAKKIKRVPLTWRKPRGFHSKMRRYKKGKPRMAAVGFKGPKALQGVLDSGLRENLVHNMAELKAVNPKTEIAIVASAVGKRKVLTFIAEAKKLGIKFGNIDPEKKKAEIEAFLAGRKKAKLEKKKKAADKKKKKDEKEKKTEKKEEKAEEKPSVEKKEVKSESKPEKKEEKPKPAQKKEKKSEPKKEEKPKAGKKEEKKAEKKDPKKESKKE